MNCFIPWLRAAAMCALIGASPIAHAQFAGTGGFAPINGDVIRDFPMEAKRGTLTAQSFDQVLLGTTPVPLSPGAVIRNANNLIIMSGDIPPGSPAFYVLDDDARLSRAWLLTPTEAELTKPAPAVPAASTPTGGSSSSSGVSGKLDSTKKRKLLDSLETFFKGE